MHSYNQVEHNKKNVFSEAQNTTALHANIDVTGIGQLLDTKKGQSAFPSGNNCQGQLQTPRSD